jgi:hypothetical protein
MNDAPDVKSAKADLAFMRGLVEDPGRSQWIAGAGFLSGGLAYGAQVLAQAAQAYGWLKLPPPLSLALGLSGGGSLSQP